jgi:hypothetical protein
VDFTNVSLESFDLVNWQPAKDVRDSVTIQLGLEELTARQWKQLRDVKGLESTNIKGVWHIRYTVESECDDTDCTVDAESTTQAAKPNVVTFGNFSTSLAVVNNISSDSIQVHNTTFNTGGLATEANTFVSQLGAFTEFLTNTDEMLRQRQQDLQEQTRIKTDALNKTRLQVENIRQRALQAQRDNIALSVQNESLDHQMHEAITEGKQLHTVLSGLSD